MYRVGSKPSQGQNTTEWDKIRDAVVKKWDTENYPQKAVSYAAYCKSIVDPFNAANLRAFMNKVLIDFAQKNTDTDYLKLVELNEGGTEPTVCGKNPKGQGVVACP